MIVGALLGAVGGVIVFIMLMVWIFRRRRRGAVGMNTVDIVPLESSADILKDAMKELEVDRNELHICEVIGQGEFGVVMHAVSSSNPPFEFCQSVAIKVLKSPATSSSRTAFTREALRLHSLGHPNIIRMIGVCMVSEPFFIILEHMSNSDLKTLLRRCRDCGYKLSLPQLIKLSMDVALGFEYLQKQRYVHRDLAARNVLVSGAFVAKIGDFGMSRRTYNSEYYQISGTSTTATSMVLPIRWMAPESYYDSVWDAASDVWMFGVLLWEIFSSADLPWNDLPDASIMPHIRERGKLVSPPGCPEDIYLLMLDCWKLDPSRRIHAGSIVLRLCKFMEDRNITSESLLMMDWPDLSTAISTAPVAVSQVLNVDDDDAKSRFSDREVEFSRITLEGQIGKGQFGSVHLGSLVLATGSSVVVAVKLLHCESLPLHGQQQVPAIFTVEKQQFLYEARILCALDHPHITCVVGVVFRSDPNVIALEFMKGGDLKSYLRENKLLLADNVPALTGACMQIGSAMLYLEQLRVIHRDLAARNVLVSAHGLNCVKLSDVGLSRPLATSEYYRKTTNMKVPVKWMAPESVLERVYTSRSDVWSFGVCCWEVYSFGDKPYANLSADQAIIAILRGLRLEKPLLCPQKIYDTLLQCWSLEPSSRPSFFQLDQSFRVGPDETKIHP